MSPAAPHTKPPPHSAGVVVRHSLGALYIDRVLPLGGVLGLKAHGITFVQVTELHVDQGIGVEEQVFLLAFNGDKAEALVGEFLDCSVHRI